MARHEITTTNGQAHKVTAPYMAAEPKIPAHAQGEIAAPTSATRPFRFSADGQVYSWTVPADAPEAELDELVNRELGSRARQPSQVTYEIDGPDGRTYEIDGPAGATRAEIIDRVKAGMQVVPQRVLEIELPDGTILEAPAGADPSTVAKGYMARQLRQQSRVTAPEQSTLASVGGMLSRGATFGFGDEISGVADAIGRKVSGDSRPFGEIYEERRSMYDSANDRFAAENPVAATALEGTGSMIPTAAAVMSGNPQLSPAVVNSTAGRIATGGALGAGAGGLSGFGNADPGERAEGAGEGAAIGGALGTAGAGLVETLSPIAQRLREPTRGILQYVDDFIAGNTRAAPAAPAASPSPRYTLAQRKISQALERDGITPAQAAEALRIQQGIGRPVGIVDVAGENTRGLGRSTVTAPGAGRQTATHALNERADNQLPRVMQDVETGVGVKAQDTDALSRQITAQRAEAARPAYQKAYAQGELTDANLVALMDQNAVFAQAHHKARALLAGAGKQIPELYNAKTSQLVRFPTVEDVDLVKKGLDRRLYNNKRGANDPDEPALDRYFAGVLEGERARLLGTVDAVAPDYAAARAAFAGETALAEALDSGRSFLNMDSREITRVMTELSPTEQEHFRLGAVDAIRRRLLAASDNADRGNLVKSILGYGKGGRRDQLAKLFRSPAELAKFEQQMQSEIAMHQTRNYMLTGSHTANKLAEANDAELGAVADVLMHLASGNARRAAMRAGEAVVQGAMNRLRPHAAERMRADVAGELFNFADPRRAQDFLRELEQIRQAQLQAGATRQRLGVAAGLGVGPASSREH